VGLFPTGILRGVSRLAAERIEIRHRREKALYGSRDLLVEGAAEGVQAALQLGMKLFALRARDLADPAILQGGENRTRRRQQANRQPCKPPALRDLSHVFSA
jgi:hypothetical protein